MFSVRSCCCCCCCCCCCWWWWWWLCSWHLIMFILKVTVCTCRSLSCVSLCSSLLCFPRFYSNMSSLMRVKGILLCENPSCSALQVWPSRVKINFFLTEAIPLCINKFVYCTMYRQYTTVYQYNDIYTQVALRLHVSTINGHLQANEEHFLRYNKVALNGIPFRLQ